MRRFLIPSFAATTALLVGSLAVGQAQNKTVPVDITLRKDADGTCTVTGSPTHIRSAKRNYKVVWHVTDHCDDRKTVTVDNFKHENDDNKKKEPVRIAKVEPAGGNGGTGAIEGRVTELKKEDLGTYKYDILIDGVMGEDPKIDIDS